MRVTDFKNAPAEASVFHGLAATSLERLGFGLINDPSETGGRFRASSALYKSAGGLHLEATFEPGDSNAAELTCGRAWFAKQPPFWSLSNYYSAAAARFGIDVPMHYSLRYGDEKIETMRTMVDHLNATLAIVRSRLTIEDLVSLEQQKFGAAAKARALFGSDFLRMVDVSEFGDDV